ncbi:MAG: hypothetical protein H7Y41_06635 [Hyphomonadaceae bacterium]|nr:hypothetical protein [Clostridia bacterium]
MGAAHARPFLKKGDKNFIMVNIYNIKVLLNFFQKIAGLKGGTLYCCPQTTKSKHSESIFLCYFLFATEKESKVLTTSKVDISYDKYSTHM